MSVVAAMILSYKLIGIMFTELYAYCKIAPRLFISQNRNDNKFLSREIEFNIKYDLETE